MTGSRCHSLSSSSLSCVLFLQPVSTRRRENVYISLARRERKIRDWSSPMIGRESIALCNFGQIIVREKKEEKDIERQEYSTRFLFLFSKHLLAFREYKRNREREKERIRRKRNLSITCLVFLFHKRER